MSSSTYREIVQHLPKRTHLSEVDYRDTLDDVPGEDILRVIAGEKRVVDLLDADWLLHSEYWAARDEVLAAASAAGVPVDEGSEDWDRLIQEVRDRDVSDPLGDLVRNSRDVVVLLALPFDALPWDAWDTDPARVRQYFGLPSDSGAVAEVSANSSQGGSSAVLVRLSWDEIAALGRAGDTDLVTFTVCSAGRFLSWSGSGCLLDAIDARLAMTVTDFRRLCAVDSRYSASHGSYTWSATVSGYCVSDFRESRCEFVEVPVGLRFLVDGLVSRGMSPLDALDAARAVAA